MLLSMTGFGKAVKEISQKKITVEIKSLNSKQLDVSMRVPPIYREIEIEIRNRVAARLERGKVDLNVYVESVNAEPTCQLNLPMLAKYKAQLENMSVELGIPTPDDWYSVLLRFPDTMKSDAAPVLEPQEAEAVFSAVDAALSGVLEHRRAEGEKLESFFAARIDNIASLLGEVPQFENERVAKIKARIEDGLSKIHAVDYDKARLEQEMIFYIEKLDVNEEKQRLAQHLSYFIETMNGRHGQGKKLGFISQEMGREINTLGSKSNHAEMQRIVVKMKDELEQIKEQVLNVM